MCQIDGEEDGGVGVVVVYLELVLQQVLLVGELAVHAE